MRPEYELRHRLNNAICSYVSFASSLGVDRREAQRAKATCWALLWALGEYEPEKDLSGARWSEIVTDYIDEKFQPMPFVDAPHVP